MTGPLILLAAIASPIAQPVPAAVATGRQFQPIGGASARATVSVRIVTGAKFGPGRAADAPGGRVRMTRITDAHGLLLPANLLEFQ